MTVRSDQFERCNILTQLFYGPIKMK